MQVAHRVPAARTIGAGGDNLNAGEELPGTLKNVRDQQRARHHGGLHGTSMKCSYDKSRPWPRGRDEYRPLPVGALHKLTAAKRYFVVGEGNGRRGSSCCEQGSTGCRKSRSRKGTASAVPQND